MASEDHMPGPVCLIENVKGQLVANQEALQILSAIEQPVVVVAIVGFYRTGKSYLMNKLAGKNTGFSLGSTVQSHTKGIWMWCVPHPQKADTTLVLLDTEGLGDVEKGDNQSDCWIFALAVLLSSTFVYNSMGAINQQAMDQLHYVTELTDRIRTRSSSDQDEVDASDEFVSFFPDFVWTVRDFSLELKINGKPISADEYLENSLRLIYGTGQRDKEKELNMPRLCIHKFFPKKKCFVFERPAPGKKLGQLESLQDHDLYSDFVEQVADFCSYVFSCSKVKRLSGGIKVNGPRLESLVTTYINTISSGGLPCLENAVLALSQTENEAAVQKAIAHYDQQMSQKLQLPTETLQELLDLHRASEKEAIKIFMENSFKDINQVFLMQVMAEEVLQKFLQSKEEVSDAILQTDQTLKEKEKETEVERVRAEATQAAARMQEEMQQENKQLLQQKKSHEKHIKVLTEKMEKVQAQLSKEKRAHLKISLECAELREENERLHFRKRRKVFGCVLC
ncbi:guanylate-binding protein 3-like isoform X2 [Alexandromys fortis]|uniref:guanylate-binding protein 3-like isoform X2 n=1 Tax=Alexandromys fortis TaxID=100897 RepID=UPI0021529F1A|nr:guanylate-binding protein 3-like isoform X2 [Microtus fortis]